MDNSRLLAVKILYSILKITLYYFCEIFLKNLAVVLFVSFTTILSANAANWVETARTANNEIYVYIDTESISTQGNYKQAFTRAINIPSERYYIALYSYDCKSNPKRTKNTHTMVYDIEGTVISSSSTALPFQPVFPGSLEEKGVALVCNF